MFWEATQARQAGRVRLPAPRLPPSPSTRHLQPWGVVRYSGRWYVVGLDTDRGEERVFRLSRVVGDARRIGAPGVVRHPRRHRPARDHPPAGARAAHRRRGDRCWCARAPGATLRRGRGQHRGRRRRAGHRQPVGPAWSLRRDRLAEELLALGPDVLRGVARPSCARTSWPGCARPSGADGWRRRREAGRRRGQGPGGPAADPGAVPARPPPGPPGRDGRAPLGSTPEQVVKDLGCCSCAGSRAATPTT